MIGHKILIREILLQMQREDDDHQFRKKEIFAEMIGSIWRKQLHYF